MVLAEQAPELVARLDAEGVFLFVSAASAALLGYEPSELVGSKASALLASRDFERIEPLLTLGVHRFFAERRAECGLLRRKDGELVLSELVAYVPREGSAGHHETVLVIRDASAQAARECEVRESEASVRALLNAVPGMIYQWTSRSVGERTFTFCNDWPRAALGIDLTDLSQLDARLAEIAHPADSAQAWQQWERAAATLEPWVWRGRFLPRNGEVVHVVGHSTPHKQADGSVLWSGVLLDDSQRRRVADALFHSEELFAAVVANMEMTHFRLDLSGNLLLINPAGVRMLGYDDARQLVGRNAATQLWLSPARFQELLDAVAREGVAAIEAPLRCRDGSLRIVQGALRLLRDEHDSATGIDAVVRDVTDERKASEELVFAREAAEAGSRAKSAFLANMSHEIRTPMNAIIGLSHLALDADPPPKHREYFTQIRAAAFSLLDIINDILDVSKIEAGKVTLELQPFDIDRVLDAVANVVAVRAAERKLEIVFAVDPRVPDELIGDRMRLGQVVMNLASNAVKFTEKGEIVVSVDLLSRDDHHARLRFAVRDTGIGMSEEQRARLFEPFSQVDSSSTRKYGGTGLGLAISQELVHLMGSEIVVSSRPDQGSEFSFEVSLDVPTGERSQKPKLEHNVRDLKVLIVDDNQVARDVLTRSLLAMGFLVCAVPSADAARDALRQAETRAAPFQLALIDMRMPETDGLELARQVGAGEVVGQPPELVMISAFSRDEIAGDRDLSHVRAFLRKPISRSTLLDTVAEVVQGQIVDRNSEHRPEVVATPSKERKRPLVGMLLLVVEDNEINQILARDLLEAAGAKVVLASDGPEALRAAAAQMPPFDVILMDVQMPGMDGHATTRALRAEAKTSETPIVAMTAHAFDAERKKCLASGMNAHIAKPINPPELVQTVLSWGRPKPPSTAPSAGERSPSEVAPAATVVGRPRSLTPRVSQAPAAKSEPSRVVPASDRPPEETGFDPSILAAVFREPARQLAFLRKFVDSARRTLGELEGAWQQKSHDEISFAGHKLKSSAKACGAHSLATVCADLERFAKTPNWERLEPLRGVADRLLEEVAQYVEKSERAAQQS
ncbi:MAG: hypothetical protein RLZZ450_2899 [Pseudomonadota bacterium]